MVTSSPPRYSASSASSLVAQPRNRWVFVFEREGSIIGELSASVCFMYFDSMLFSPMLSVKVTVYIPILPRLTVYVPLCESVNLPMPSARITSNVFSPSDTVARLYASLSFTVILYSSDFSVCSINAPSGEFTTTQLPFVGFALSVIFPRVAPFATITERLPSNLSSPDTPETTAVVMLEMLPLTLTLMSP